MSLAKNTNSKRTTVPLVFGYTDAFLKDWTSLSHLGRYNMNRLKEVMLLIIVNEFPLPPEWLDHSLKGNYADHRECHVVGDFLLIYRIENGQVMFVRTGTHSELFR